MDKLTSVIIRTIDRPYMLEEALESVCLQDYPNVEVILVNDGGPSLQDFVNEQFQSLDIKLIENKQTMGRSYAGNQGLDHAKGDYIGFLDDDDIYYPFHLSELIDELEEKQVDVVYANGLCASQIKCPFDQRKYMTVDLLQEKGKKFSRDHLLADNFIPLNTVVFTKQALGNSRFDENLDVLEDWDFWLNLSKNNQFHYIDKITSEYRARIDNSNTTGQLDHIWWWSREYLQEKHQDLTYNARRS